MHIKAAYKYLHADVYFRLYIYMYVHGYILIWQNPPRVGDRLPASPDGLWHFLYKIPTGNLSASDHQCDESLTMQQPLACIIVLHGLTTCVYFNSTCSPSLPPCHVVVIIDNDKLSVHNAGSLYLTHFFTLYYNFYINANIFSCIFKNL